MFVEIWFSLKQHFREGDKLAPNIEKRISEVEVGLLHLQQNIDIPEISLVVHPVVQAAVKKARDEGKVTPRGQDFASYIEDSTFLNNLQNTVNRWIREIQKVCWVFNLLLVNCNSKLILLVFIYLFKKTFNWH